MPPVKSISARNRSADLSRSMVAGLVQRRLADVFGVRFIRRTADGLHYRAYEEDALGQARLTLVRAGLPVCVRVDPASLEFTVVLRLSPLL